MNTSDILKRKAIELGLCKEWTDGWGNPKLEQLVEMYIEGIDFCIKNDYPSNEFIKKHFGKVAENYGVYVDANINLLNPDIVIAQGDTKGSVVLSEFASRDIYVRHNSDITIIIKDHSKAFIRVFDNAKVRVLNQDYGKAFIYKYVDNFKGSIEIEGDVLIRDRVFADL